MINAEWCGQNVNFDGENVNFDDEKAVKSIADRIQKAR